MNRNLVRGAAKFLGVVLVILVAVGIVMRVFFVDPVTVAHNGMAPTMILGDTVLVWRGASVDHGDIVVCRHPSEDRYVMGRVMAVDGMSVAERRDHFAINGVVPAQDYRGTITFTDATRDRSFRMRWGIESLGNDHHYFFEEADRGIRVREVGRVHGVHLVGDNRAYIDEDSRFFGDVDPSTCIGEVFMRLAPTDHVDLGAEIPHGWLEFLE